MSRTPFIAGNWKMNKTVAEAERYIQALLPQVAAVDGVEIVVCPPFLALGALVDSARGSQVGIYAQTMHEADSGAYTGEVSAAMLTELDVAGVVLGHSERRQYFDETDKALQLKVPKALETGLTPILCVGETRGGARARRDRAAAAQPGPGGAREGARPSGCPRSSIAYEPIWAIGTGKTATPEQAQEACSFIRALVANRDKAAAEQVRVVYGGSCKPDNAAELLALRGRRRRARRRRQPRSRPTSRRSSRPPRRDGPRRLPRRARRLGARARRPGQRGRARRHAGVRRALGASTRTRR